jgi:pyridoxamine 5'-phosphate oxidase
MTFDQMRISYTMAGLSESDLDADPFKQFVHWFHNANADDKPEWLEINAMTLATVDGDGRPDARVVLLRRITDTSLVWFTDRRSAKGEQLVATPHAALVFHWQPLARQGRLRGPVVELDDAQSDAYFASRPRGSRLSAWASHQSQPTASREAYERQVEDVEARFEGVEDVPRPPYWGGYALAPVEVELWQGRRSRRHDRLRFRADGAGAWTLERLQP